MYQLKDFEYLVSGLAVTTTILQFLSGVLVCKQYVERKTTADATPLPFICGVVSSALWLLYGMTKNDGKIILVNAVGLSLMISYTVVFYMYTFKKSQVAKLVLLVSLFLFIIITYISSEEDNDLLLSRLGLMACLFTLATIAAPLTKLTFVLKVKSTECLPFPMILMSFFVSALWYFYGVIKSDPYLCIPNFIGAVLAISQLSLFVIYPHSPSGTDVSFSA